MKKETEEAIRILNNTIDVVEKLQTSRYRILSFLQAEKESLEEYLKERDKERLEDFCQMHLLDLEKILREEK
jgi:DNA-binding GntR family transcriptional regulator